MYNHSKIFGIGLPRTGTTSLHNALKLLGIKSKNFPFELYTSFDNSVLENYDAFVDSPIPMIYKDLDILFPGSKFILTKRSLDSWIESMEWLYEHGSVKFRPSELVYNYRKEFLGCEKFKRKILVKKYNDFHYDVMNYFEKRENDLLILDIENDAKFESLCTFLKKEVVDIEYPKSNRRTHISLTKRLIYHYLIRNCNKIKNIYKKNSSYQKYRYLLL